MNIRLSYQGGTFTFSRDSIGVGAWYCIGGRCPGLFGKSHVGTAVPLAYVSILTHEAINRGLATHKDLSWTVKREKPVAVKTSGPSVKKTARDSLFRGAFNPFASMENNPDAEGLVVVGVKGSKKYADQEESTDFFSTLFASDDEDVDSYGELELAEIEFEEVTSEEEEEQAEESYVE